MENQHPADAPDTTTIQTPKATSDEAEIIAMQRDLEQRREALGIMIDEKFEGRVADLMRRFVGPPMTAEQIAAEVNAERQRKAQAELERRDRMWRFVADAVGERYHSCRIGNFVISDKPEVAKLQTVAIERVSELAMQLQPHIESGGNVILYGPPGTGKDHLLIALLRSVVYKHGYDARWCNGQELFGAFRDNISTDTSESNLIARYSSPMVLAISDPVPPKGEASVFAASMLYRLIDARYRRKRGTWATVNVMTGGELSDALTAPVADRLRDNTVSVFCNWPSYRQTNKPEWLK